MALNLSKEAARAISNPMQIDAGFRTVFVLVDSTFKTELGPHFGSFCEMALLSLIRAQNSCGAGLITKC